MYEFTVPMGLMDFIPVILFAVSAVLLQRDLYNKMPKYAFACFAAGTINVFLAGFLKALWKLLYAAGICDFQVLNTMFLPVNSIGFLLAGLGIVLMYPVKNRMLAVAPPVFKGTPAFISMMVLGLGAVCVCLAVFSAKLNRKGNIAIFALTFICYLGMGYLGSRDSSSAAANWIEQSINCVGQLLMLAGVLILHRAGLREYKQS